MKIGDTAGSTADGWRRAPGRGEAPPAPTERVVPAVLRRQIAARPDQEFIRCGGEWMTFGAVDDRSRRLAAGLAALGVGRGDRIATVMPSRSEFVDVFYAAARLGAVVVPINAYLKGQFLRYQLVDCLPKVVFCDDAGLQACMPHLAEAGVEHVVVVDALNSVPAGNVHAIDEIRLDEDSPDASIEPSDLLAISYTSGTTGMPKGCMLSHGYYTSMPAAFFEAGWFELGSERLMTSTPVINAGGHALLNMIGLMGGIAVSYAEFHASTYLDLARKDNISFLFGTGLPGMAMLAQAPRPDDADNPLRCASFMPLPPAKQQEFAQRFNVTVLEGSYGQTEVVPVTVAPVASHRPETCGRVVSSLEVAVVDEHDELVPDGAVGEIVVRPRGPLSTFSGYWGRPADTLATWRSLWHHTGDSGRLDAEGYLIFVDRIKDAIRRRGGMNVSSYELEMSLAQHPKIDVVAAYAVPSEMTEDEIMVALVLKPQAELTPAEFFEFARAELPYFAIPRYVEIRQELPLNAMRRVMKDRLRAAGVTESAWDLETLGFHLTRSERRG